MQKKIKMVIFNKDQNGNLIINENHIIPKDREKYKAILTMKDKVKTFREQFTNITEQYWNNK